ncbi:uncharacterized protein LOC144578341 [Callithrix jacchus]
MFSRTFLFPNPSCRQFSEVQAPLLPCRPPSSRPSRVRSPTPRRLNRQARELRRPRPTELGDPHLGNPRGPLSSPARAPRRTLGCGSGEVVSSPTRGPRRIQRPPASVGLAGSAASGHGRTRALRSQAQLPPRHLFPTSGPRRPRKIFPRRNVSYTLLTLTSK